MNLGVSAHLRPILDGVRDLVRNEIMPLDEEFLKSARKETAGAIPRARLRYSKG
jgi:hypothetical protein